MKPEKRKRTFLLPFVSVLIIPDRSDVSILLRPPDLLDDQPRLWSVAISTQLINELTLEI